MTRRLISSGSPFEKVMGYSRAVVDGDWVFVAGTTGFFNGQIADAAPAQTDRALLTIEAALKDAGASLADVVRVVVYLTDVHDFGEVAKVLGSRFSEIRPANSTVVVTALVDPRMKVEVEVTALKRRKAKSGTKSKSSAKSKPAAKKKPAAKAKPKAKPKAKAKAKPKAKKKAKR